jgi:hypothetical protein
MPMSFDDAAAEQQGAVEQPAVPEPAGAERAATAFREVVIIGGGCYGSFYAGQLRTALERGRIRAEVISVIDRDRDCQAARTFTWSPPFALVTAEWDQYLDALLERPAPLAERPDDAIVPSPLMPHLMANWLLRWAGRRHQRTAVTVIPLEPPLGTPYDRLGRDDNRYLSFADWLCPTHCIEPHICPVTRGPRTWEMADALIEYVARRNRHRPTLGPALFLTRHRAHGVGMFDAAEARSAARLLEEAIGRPDRPDLVVATVSSCHGAAACLRPGPGSPR